MLNILPINIVVLDIYTHTTHCYPRGMLIWKAEMRWITEPAPLEAKFRVNLTKKKQKKGSGFPCFSIVKKGWHFADMAHDNDVQDVESSSNMMVHGDAREGEWRGNWWMEWIASTLHIASQHGVSSITTADAHTSAASSRLNWRPRRFKWKRPFRRKTKSGFCACAITFQTQSNLLHLWSTVAASKADCSDLSSPQNLSRLNNNSDDVATCCNWKCVTKNQQWGRNKKSN